MVNMQTQKNPTQIISLELNEINFDYIKVYVGKGMLPTFAELLSKYTLFETSTEEEGVCLEPWIQWPTVYTGKTYTEHGIFRLGDSTKYSLTQVWEALECKGLKVGAFSPMNAANRCNNSVFFLPDPWTNTPINAPPILRKLYDTIRAIVNSNAHHQLEKRVLINFLLFVLPFINLKSIPYFVKYVNLSLKYRWARAMILDRLLADIFLRLWKNNSLNYASLFLNAGAHIQHHYMYDSTAYEGNQTNPDWYSRAVADSVDPLFQVYQAYDQILSKFLSLPKVRLFVTTALSQRANTKKVFQYRFIDYDNALRQFGIDNCKIEPRMSRDFTLFVKNKEIGKKVANILSSLSCNGRPFIEVDNRGDSLFCMICYFEEPSNLQFVMQREKVHDLRDKVVLVSIENAVHQSKGYHVDTHHLKQGGENCLVIPLTSIFDKTLDAFSKKNT